MRRGRKREAKKKRLDYELLKWHAEKLGVWDPDNPLEIIEAEPLSKDVPVIILNDDDDDDDDDDDVDVVVDDDDATSEQEPDPNNNPSDASDSTITLCIWMKFKSKGHLREVLTDFCVQEKFNVHTVSGDNYRYTVKCADAICNWRLHATLDRDEVTWYIKSMQLKHCCQQRSLRNPRAGVKWLARKLLHDIRDDPNVSIATLIRVTFERFGEKVPYPTMPKVKAYALKILNGNGEERDEN